MNLFVLAVSLLLALPVPAQAASPAQAPVMQPRINPEASYTGLCNDTAALLRRALALPDAQALALLHGPEAARLLKRQQEIGPTVRAWGQGLTAAQRRELGPHLLAQNNLMKFMQAAAHDAKLEARTKRNPKLMEALKPLAEIITLPMADK